MKQKELNTRVVTMTFGILGHKLRVQGKISLKKFFSLRLHEKPQPPDLHLDVQMAQY